MNTRPRLRFPLAAAMLAAMTITGAGLTGCQSSSLITEPRAEDERGIALADMPPPARQSIEKLASGAQIEECRTMIEEGSRMFVAEFERDGRDVEVEVYADGRVCCVETETKLEELPRDVRASASSHLNGLNVTECVTKESKGTTTYVVEGKKTGQKVSVELDRTGKVITKEVTSGK